MIDDAALLRRYAEDRDEAAFTELVRRHLDGVYSIAQRRVGGDAHLAQDVAQQVFLGLARDAKRLSAHPVLAGWLHTATRNASANVVRGERRRKAHEQELHAMQNVLSKGPSEADWNRLAPVIEEAVDQLGDSDRVAVLLRFVERQTFGEIGSALRLTEDAARKRVDRALEKLRVILGRRGVDSSAAALAAVLTTNAVGSAPAGLVTTVATAAMNGAATAGGGFTLTLISMTKIQIALLGAVLLAGGLSLVLQQTAGAKYHVDLAPARPPHIERTQPSRGEGVSSIEGTRVEADTKPKPLTEPGTSASARLRPAETWRNHGRATPKDALETVFWATWSLDHAALGKTIAVDPVDRARLETVFALIPDFVREKLKITSPEEIFAGVWALENNDRYATLLPGSSTAQGSDEAEVQFEFQRAGEDRISTGRMRFRRGADGWQWVVPHGELERMESDFRRNEPGPNMPEWARKIWGELYGKRNP